MLRSSALALLLVAGTAIAQQPPPQPLAIKPLKPSVYLAQGGAGGNSGVIVGSNGVIVIDAKATAASAKQMLDQIAKLTPKRVTTVILTHGDPEHTGGLPAFPGAVTIVAHVNARQGLPPDRPASKLIERTGETLTIGDVTVELHHWAPAHTAGDLVVYLPDQKIAFAGDVVVADQKDPVIQLEQRGSTEGWITTVKGTLGLPADQIVPGHGDVLTRAELQARLNGAVEKRDKIAALVRERKSLDEIKTAVGDPPAGPVPVAPGFTDIVFRELTGRQ